MLFRSVRSGGLNQSVGLTHQTVERSFVPGDVSAGLNTITVTGFTPANGTALFMAGDGPLPGTLQTNVVYYVVGVAGSTFGLAATPGDAAIALTVPSGSIYVVGTSLPAVPGVDYATVAGTSTFAEGQVIANFVVAVLKPLDTNPENSRSIPLEISVPTGGATLGTLTEAVLTINDDDSVVGYQLSAFSVSE